MNVSFLLKDFFLSIKNAYGTRTTHDKIADGLRKNERFKDAADFVTPNAGLHTPKLDDGSPKNSKTYFKTTVCDQIGHMDRTYYGSRNIQRAVPNVPRTDKNAERTSGHI